MDQSKSPIVLHGLERDSNHDVISAHSDGGVLRPLGTAEDLVARGFGREEVIERTGEDPGPRNSYFLKTLRGVDRHAYKVEHVRRRVGLAEAEKIAAGFEYGDLDRAGVLMALGLGPRLPATSLKLSDLYEQLGLADHWGRAEKAQRTRSRARAAATNIERYGGVSPMSSEQVRAKVRQSTRASLGVDNASQAEVVKRKKREAAQRRYGVDSPLAAPEVRAKIATTVREHYGVENVSQAQRVKDRKVASSRARYGVDHVLQASEVRQAQLRTLRERFPDLPADAAGALASPTIRHRAQDTHRERHGVENPFELEQTQQQVRQSMLERHGVENASLSPQIRQRRLETFRERFGVDNPFQHPAVKAASRVTNLERYGVEFIAQLPESRARSARIGADPEVTAKQVEAKRANGTLNMSNPEESLYLMLVEHFGEGEVLRQYSADLRYPFLCDFYVPSRDLFIELNGSWTHGRHWHEPEREADVALMGLWLAKDTAYYDNAVHVWTVADPAKRQVAREHGLNYVVFWDGTDALADARLWLALGAPDGRDWEREHSWFPEREVDFDPVWPDRLEDGPRQAIAAARAATGLVRLQRELRLWAADEVHPTRWGRLRARLSANRLRYLGKLPSELTDSEILRGLGIAGELRAHTVFDNTGMVQVLDRYAPASVYDPCAGWGERLVTCAARGIGYRGTDVNPDTVAGHEALVEHYGLTEQSTRLGDAAQVDARAGVHEMVFTCPPYGSVEVYSEHGAENLDHDDFIVWWGQVVQMSVSDATAVFAYQINQALKGPMNEVLEQAGWSLVDSIPVKAGRLGHFRRAGAKTNREFEEVQVFERRRL